MSRNCAMMKERLDENRFYNAVAGMYRRAGSISALRLPGRLSASRPPRATQAPRTRVPQEGRDQSESTRSEAKGHAPRFGPRGRFLERNFFRSCLRFHSLASEFLVHDALAKDLRHGEVKPI